MRMGSDVQGGRAARRPTPLWNRYGADEAALDTLFTMHTALIGGALEKGGGGDQ